MTRIDKIIHGFTRSLTHLLIAGSTLSLTPAHALQTTNGTWVEAQYLHTGDQLITPQGIVTIDDVCTETVAPTPVISYELEGNLPYFVGNVPVLAAGTCNLQTIKAFLSTNEYNAFRNTLISLGLNTSERAALFRKIVSFGDEVNTSTFTEFMNAFSTDARFARGIVDDVELMDVWKGIVYLKSVRNNADFLAYCKKFKNILGDQGKKLFEHIFEGVTGAKAGEANIKGVHHSSALRTSTPPAVGDIRIDPTTRVNKADGFYEAEIEYFDGTTWHRKRELIGEDANGNKIYQTIKNGFYPDAWNVDRVLEELAYARSRMTASDWIRPATTGGKSNSYAGTLRNGQRVTMYIGQSVPAAPTTLSFTNFIVSIFPVF